MLAYLGAGYLRVAWLRRRATPIAAADWSDDLARAARVLGVSKPVLLYESSEVGAPMACGIRRPAICIPTAARGWDAERRRLVLLHEMAHILRNDAVTHLAARIALCVYWFHPLAWLSFRQFVRERERACDDLVLEAGARPSEYAGHLLEVAASMTPAAAGWAGVFMARRSQLEGRLVAILDARARRGAVAPAFTAAAVLAALMVTVPVAAMRPEPQAPPPATAAEMDALIRTSISARDNATIERTMKAMLVQRKFQDAEKLAATALQIREQRYGQASPEYSQGLVQQGDVQRAAGKLIQAEESYNRAVAIQGGGDAATLLLLARTAHGKKEYEKAAGLYQQALTKAGDAKTRATALAWLGLMREQLKEYEAAEYSYQQAMQAAEPGTAEHATALELFSRLIAARGRVDEAKAMETRATEIRKAIVRGTSRELNATQAPPSPFKVGNGVEPPKLIFKLEPSYSEVARAAKYQGTVVLAVVVDRDGVASQINLMRGIGLELDEQAVEAVRQWKFKPGTKDGQPVSVMATIEVNFRLL
jgi:TonB family protein